MLCTLTAWIGVWVVAVVRWVARGRNRWLAHLLGALLGIVAAFGAFCLSGALLMPGTGETHRRTSGLASWVGWCCG